jgi:catechol 2,3-dioxygenase
MRIGHAHLKVRDLEIATAFYQQTLGLSVRESIGQAYVFMSGTDAHHELALQSVGAEARTPGRYDTGLFHLAFEVPDRAALAARYLRIRELGIQVVPVDHRISWALYFSDPDGNGVEIYCDTRSDDDGSRLWHGADRPLTEERLLAEHRNA